MVSRGETESSGTSPVRVCRDSQGDGRSGRLHNSRSISLPTSRAASPSARGDESTTSAASVDYTLGAYQRRTRATIPLYSGSDSSTSRMLQPMKLNDVSTYARTDCVGNCAKPADAWPTLAAGPDEEVEPGHDDDDDDQGRPIAACHCEGACACCGAIDEFSDNTALVLRRNSIEESASARIFRLFRQDSHPCSLDSILSLSTSCSTPSATFGKSYCHHRKNVPRIPAICSQESSVAKSLTVSDACGSYEKLSNEFDVVSEATSILGTDTLANTPETTPSKFTYDPTNLCENIKVLNSFLAQRSGTDNEQTKRGKSMLLGTSKHQFGSHHVSSSTDRTCKNDSARICRSYDDDNFFN